MSPIPNRRDRLPIVLSTAALVVAVLGTTPLAGAARDAVLPRNSVGAAQLKPNAVTGDKVKDGSLAATDFKTGQLPAGAQGPAGPRGPAGPTDTSKLLGRTVTVAASKSLGEGVRYDFVRCPSGYEAIGGGAYTEELKITGGLLSSNRPRLLESSPLLADGAPPSTVPGPSATAWGTRVWIPSDAGTRITWYVVCAKAGA
jgi:hypothetical protein